MLQSGAENRYKLDVSIVLHSQEKSIIYIRPTSVITLIEIASVFGTHIKSMA